MVGAELPSRVPAHASLNARVPDSGRADNGERALQEEDYRLLVHSSPEAILVECDSSIVFANPAALMLFAADSLNDMLGRSLMSLMAPSMRDRITLKDGHASREEPAVCLDGRVIDIAVTRRRLEYLGRSAIYMIAHDISERKRVELQLQHQATHDGLTGLPNRSLLIDRLKLAIAEARRYQQHFLVAFIDLDRFKWVNDNFGHEAGDTLLKTVAYRMSDCLRESDTIARLGGDEFVLVLRDSGNGEESMQVLDRVIACASTPVTIAGQEMSVTCSIGCCTYPEDGEDPESLLRASDAAMYRAKEVGRNRTQHLTEELRRRFDDGARLAADMRVALEREEFELHYQLQTDLTSGAIVGAEALLRWRHPMRGLLEPTHFIRVAEDTGLIGPIGDWAFGEACRQNKAWQDAGLVPMPVAINLSAKQLVRPGLTRGIADCLARTCLHPGFLELELSEATSMDNPGLTLIVMQGLRDVGVQLSIDDFGTGFSNLPFLQRFTLDRVKLDGSIVQNIASDPNTRALAEAMIALAHRLGMIVIAARVETAEQLAALVACGCDQGQGHLIAAPLCASECVALIQDAQRRA
jgi:diguanylate cyclase (GGDEF)-like protein/PAS domain S-box-containing protein